MLGAVEFNNSFIFVFTHLDTKKGINRHNLITQLRDLRTYLRNPTRSLKGLADKPTNRGYFFPSRISFSSRIES